MLWCSIFLLSEKYQSLQINIWSAKLNEYSKNKLVFTMHISEVLIYTHLFVLNHTKVIQYSNREPNGEITIIFFVVVANT